MKRLVRKELINLGLQVEDKSSDISLSDLNLSNDDSASSSDKIEHKSKHSLHKKKSGIKAKSSDKVLSPQKWPHAHLQFEYVNKQVKFDDLDFKMFIAGELEIISGAHISNTERIGRLDLLKKIVYYSSTYEFKGLKSFYAAWLREIELGKKSWSDDPQQLETAILTKYLRTTKGPSSIPKREPSKNSVDAEKVWFCNMYQRNKCPHKNSHMIVVKGQSRLAQHICATCWLKDKAKLAHPECSSSCPHITA